MFLLLWRRGLCAVAIVGALWLSGCGSPTAPTGTVLSLGNSDNGRLLSVRLGDQIDVTLQTVGPGQYDEQPSVSSSAVVFSRVTLLTPPNPAGPRQLFQFRAAAAGHTVISISHSGQNPPFEITVDVR